MLIDVNQNVLLIDMWSGLTNRCNMLPKNGPFFGPLMLKTKIVFEITIDQETNHINYEVNTPPQVEVENAKISGYVESTHHFNIFSESVFE